jgi:tight adherence protein C
VDAPHERPVDAVTATALAVLWGAVVVGWRVRARPVALGRAFALAPRAERDPTRVTEVLAHAAAAALPAPRHAAVVVGSALVVGVLFPPAAFAVLLVACARPFLARRRASAELAVRVERDVADVVALVALAVSAGCNLPGALEAASSHAEGPLAEALRDALAHTRRGTRLGDALEALPERLGEEVRPFVAALVACDRYGAALGPALDRLVVEVRTASRQRAEAAARRLPVQLLFPLVTCILPAFALLTVAPLIAGSFQGLGL